MAAIEITKKEKKLAIIVSVVFVLTVGGPTFAVDFFQTYVAEQQAINRNLNKEIVEFDQQLSTIEERRRQLRANRANYLGWVNRGVVGEQDPVLWVKLVQSVQTKRAFQPVNYKFSGEGRRVATGGALISENSDIQISALDMNLEMPMLHDLDMFMMLDDMKSDSSSFFFPTGCNFTRLNKEFDLANAVNVNGQCNISWISVVDPQQRADLLQ